MVENFEVFLTFVIYVVWVGTLHRSAQPVTLEREFTRFYSLYSPIEAKIQ